jgi:hypothetical protein
VTELSAEIRTALHFTARLETLGVRYLVSGSFASAIHGEPRATNDIDLAVELTLKDVGPLCASLRKSYYIDEATARDAVRRGASFNAIHLETFVKIDVFVVGSDPASLRALDRRQRIPVTTGDAPTIYVATPEDVVARKLAWFRRGGEVSDRQWRDVLGVLKVQGGKIDQKYLEEITTILNVRDLLVRALADAGS